MERFQLEFDVHYGYWYNAMCETFYRRTDFVCNFVQLVGGSAAVTGVFSSTPWLVALSGSMLAMVAAISLLVQPGAKAEIHAQIKTKWLDLKARVHALKDDRLRAEVANHQKAEIGLSILSLPASNAAMRSLGYSDGFAPLGPLQRLASKFAL